MSTFHLLTKIGRYINWPRTNQQRPPVGSVTGTANSGASSMRLWNNSPKASHALSVDIGSIRRALSASVWIAGILGACYGAYDRLENFASVRHSAETVVTLSQTVSGVSGPIGGGGFSSTIAFIADHVLWVVCLPYEAAGGAGAAIGNGAVWAVSEGLDGSGKLLKKSLALL